MRPFETVESIRRRLASGAVKQLDTRHPITSTGENEFAQVPRPGDILAGSHTGSPGEVGVVVISVGHVDRGDKTTWQGVIAPIVEAEGQP